MTSATSERSDEQLLDTTVGACKRLLIMAYSNYNKAAQDNAHCVASYWDGYIRGIQHVLESQGE
jgi:hypothetical protein